MIQKFRDFLQEKVLNIGLNPDHEKHREAHRQEIHDILRSSYKDTGGYGGRASGSKEESEAIHDDISKSMMKAVKRNGKVVAVALYKKQFGRKAIGGGTDGSKLGKLAYSRTLKDDNKQKRAWGEFSGAPEHIQRKLGVPVVPSYKAAKLTGKDVKIVDNERYKRKIGDHEHEKVIMGHPKP